MSTLPQALPKHDSCAAILRVAISVFVFADNGLVLDEPSQAEGSRIERLRRAVDDPFGEDSTYCRSRLEAAAAVAGKYVAALNVRMAVDDRLAVLRHGDGSRPAPAHPRIGHRGNPLRQFLTGVLHVVGVNTFVQRIGII